MDDTTQPPKTKNTNGKHKCLICPVEIRSDKYIDHIIRYHRGDIISAYSKADREILINTKRPYLVYSRRQVKASYDFAICLECRQGTTPYSRKSETPAKFINTHHNACKCKEVFDAKFKSEFESTQLDNLTVQMSVPAEPAPPAQGDFITDATKTKLIEFLTVKGKGFVEDDEEDDDDDTKPTNDELVMRLIRCYIGRAKSLGKLADERDKFKKRIEKLEETLEEEQEKCLEFERENEILKENLQFMRDRYKEATGEENEIVFG